MILFNNYPSDFLEKHLKKCLSSQLTVMSIKRTVCPQNVGSSGSFK